MSKFELIIGRFCQNLPWQVATLSDRMDLISGEGIEPPMALTQCMEDAHRLAGAAGCAGFDALRAAADDLEAGLLRLGTLGAESGAQRRVLKQDIKQAMERVSIEAGDLAPTSSKLWGLGASTNLLTRERALEKFSILIADDDDISRRILEAMLSEAGAPRIALAPNGLEAIDQLASFRPNAIIANWRMTPVTGLELLKLLRSGKTSASANLPFLMLTKYGDEAHLKIALDAGASHYIVKPFTRDTVVKAVAMAIAYPKRQLNQAPRDPEGEVEYL